MKKNYFLILHFVMAFYVTDIAHGQEVFKEDTPNCYSRSNLYVKSVLTVRQPTIQNVDILLISNTGPKIEVFCLQFQEEMNGIQPDVCPVSVPYICRKNIKAAEDDPWDCESGIVYNSATYHNYVRGSSLSSDKYFYKIQWNPMAKGANCYPRQITMDVVVRVEQPEDSNLIVAIIFIIIFVLVGLMAGLFGYYQMNKVRRKFWKKEERHGKLSLDPVDLQNSNGSNGGMENPPNEEVEQDSFEEGCDSSTQLDGGFDYGAYPPQDRNMYYQDKYYGCPANTNPIIAQESSKFGNGGYPSSTTYQWQPESLRTVVPLVILQDQQAPMPQSNMMMTPSKRGQMYSQQYSSPRQDYEMVQSSPIKQNSNPHSQASLMPTPSMTAPQQAIITAEPVTESDEEEEALACAHCYMDVLNRTETPQICQVSGKRHY